MERSSGVRALLWRIVGILALFAIAVAAWLSVRLARADAEFRQGTPEGVERAAELAPLNTAYLALKALQMEYAGVDPRRLLDRMARITPDASSPRVRLGLDAETRGDTATAERWLLDAARVDHQFEPRWTLANFYFRQENREAFWKWIRAALDVSYGDRSAVFDLCWRVAPDAAVILDRAISDERPDEHPVLSAFVAYLVGHDRGDAAPAAIRLSRETNTSDDKQVLHLEMDRLLQAGRDREAREIWSNLGYPPFPAQGNLVLHPDFEAPRIGHGFDWRLLPNPGVKFAAFDMPPVLRMAFDGMEPESCALLAQYVAVQRGKRYRLRWESRRISGEIPGGLVWHIAGAGGSLSVGEDWAGGEVAFTPAQDYATLQLDYARPLGEVRIEGSLELRHVSVEELP